MGFQLGTIAAYKASGMQNALNMSRFVLKIVCFGVSLVSMLLLIIGKTSHLTYLNIEECFCPPLFKMQ